METSSPLAALRPAPPAFGGQRDLFRSRAHTHFSDNPLGSGTFNFNLRDQFNLNHPGYFSLKGINGSSPTVSLAADLSQNFSITEAR
jgi:M-phase inducer tyrosine phosphatase